MTRPARFRRFGLLLMAVAAVSCARGADQARLQSDLQERLNRDVKPGLFDVVGVRREGSAPLPPSSSGAQRIVVYFNATLRLKDDYEFGGWDQLGPASLAYALGATEKGVFGLTQENHRGDLVRAYGSAIYEQDSRGWTIQPVELARAVSAPDLEGTSPPSHSKQLIDKLASMVDVPPPGVTRHQDEIIAQELSIAAENIERRFKRNEQTFTLATGPGDGEYTRVGETLVATVNDLAPAVKLRLRQTAGSVENAWLLSRGEADYALMQGDVAAAAFAAHEPFDRGGPLGMLRAVGGLFPEAVHVLVLRDSPLRSIPALKKQRVAIGQSESGSRFDAVAVLAAHDLQLSELHEVTELPLSEALARLSQKRTDAVFVTAAAPMRTLQQFALSPGFRLLSMEQDEIEAAVHARPGLARITLPANTYPQQRDAVDTVAAIALLVTTVDAPSGEVEKVRDLLSLRLHRHQPGSDAAPASSHRQMKLFPIPMHPGLSRRTP